MNYGIVIPNLRTLLGASDGGRWSSDGMLSLTLRSSLAIDVVRVLEDEGIYFKLPVQAQSLSSLPVGISIGHEPYNAVERMVIVPDLAGLLKLSKAWQREPEAYLTWVDGSPFLFRLGESVSSLPEPLKSYHEAIKLWQILKEHAHHQDSDESLWYFGIRKTEIVPGFTESDLVKPLDVSFIQTFMGGRDATETRKEIFSSRIAVHLQDQEPATRFPFLLHSVPTFARGLKEAMSIYLCEHSPERLEEEAKKAALDFTEKVEKIVAGLETKSLTIPLALLLSYKEISGSFWHNFAILLASLLYLTGIIWVWYTQSSMLSLLHAAINEKRAEFEKKGLDRDNPILKGTLKTLQERAHKSEIFAGVMVACSAAPFAAGLLKWMFVR